MGQQRSARVLASSPTGMDLQQRQIPEVESPSPLILQHLVYQPLSSLSVEYQLGSGATTTGSVADD